MKQCHSTKYIISLVRHSVRSYIRNVPKAEFLALRVNSDLKREIESIADDEQRSISQICEMFLYEGVEAYKKDGLKLMQRLIAKQKLRSK